MLPLLTKIVKLQNTVLILYGLITFAWPVITGCGKERRRHNMHGMFVEKTQEFRLLHFLCKRKQHVLKGIYEKKNLNKVRKNILIKHLIINN